MVCILYVYHVSMKRIALFLTEQQIAELKLQQKATGLSVSDLIRRAIDKQLKSTKKGDQK